MNNIDLILLKAGVWISASFLIYHFLLRRERWFKFNRFFILFSLLLSFVIPFLQIRLSQPSPIINNFTFVDEIWQDVKLNEVIVQKEAVQNISLFQVFIIIYSIGVLLCFLRIFMHLFKLWQLIHTHKKRRLGKLNIISTGKDSAPFSFFHYVFMNPSLGNTGEISDVVKHEKAHAAQYHSLDILLVEIALALQWFNPFMYWLRKALKEVHEYLADACVVRSGSDKIAYQKNLLRQIQVELQPALASGFNYSLIKRRITMISKIKTNKLAYGKLLIALPLLFAGMFLLSFSNSYVLAQSNSEPEAAEISGSKDIPCIRPVDETKSKISSEYGMRMHPIYNVEKFHKGVDFKAPVGTPVKTTATGTVRKIETEYEQGKGYGMYIIIDHVQGYSTMYTQLSGYKVKEGEKVKCGEVIGYVGETGITTGPHLHYEVMKDGENVNPADYY